LRSGLSLHPPPEDPELRCCPSSLYTFPAGICPGLARDCHLRIPRIWAVLHRRFPGRALKFSLSPLRMPFRHARAVVSFSVVYHRAHSGNLHGFARKKAWLFERYLNPILPARVGQGKLLEWSKQ